jgi:Ras homolog gene family, member A
MIPCSRLSQGREGITNASTTELKHLHDIDQPFTYDIRMYNRPYRFEFYDTASPQNYTLLRPDFVILCYDINDRASLEESQRRWRKEVILHFRREDRIPVMLLGLKRDLRAMEAPGMVDPLEVRSLLSNIDILLKNRQAYRIAQEMRCDRYAECSALTGELMHEAFEDIARVAAMTTTERGGQTDDPACSVQ